MPYKYLGPADVMIFDGKEYRPGDNVPMSKELMEHHAVWGQHRFEGHEDLTQSAPPQDMSVPPAFGDGGEIIVTEGARSQARTPELTRTSDATKPS